MKHMSYTLSEDGNSTLDVYLHNQSKEMRPVNKRPLVLIFPGGGYSFCSDREADPVAFKYLGEGFHSAVLRYCVGDQRNFKTALNEASTSINMIRTHAKAWNVDPDRIYVLGFSAGGHLAAAVSNLGEHKPNGCLLGYPALLGSFAYLMNIDAPSLETCVTALTPPTFLFTTFGDDLVPVENTIKYMNALEKHDVPFEAHIFERGAHGLSVADASIMNDATQVEAHFARWFDLSVEWIRLQNEPTPAIPDNTLQKLMENSETKETLLELIPLLKDPEMIKIVRNFTLQRVLEFYFGTLEKGDAKRARDLIHKSVLREYL
ncbi:hypothetical protein AOC36_10615 [Erysipelothrix larvae]|uniref:Alpha/beta hydrolase n=1 Tax=Erysipelothrix larvae TaxID=1514105 RepID=A0A0X8H1J4_9FIRM|nr:alpha/beta hydrolase [Erysipelothrix larvae]AMC94407.1 hypothetical protein AOC36_10615 [Erysipelothrix larvae]